MGRIENDIICSLRSPNDGETDLILSVQFNCLFLIFYSLFFDFNQFLNEFEFLINVHNLSFNFIRVPDFNLIDFDAFIMKHFITCYHDST